MDLNLTPDEKQHITQGCEEHKKFIYPRLCDTFMYRDGKYRYPSDEDDVCGLAHWCWFAKRRLMAYRRKYGACKTIYLHSKKMKDDPEALSDDFIQDMVGIKCKKLEDEKEE